MYSRKPVVIAYDVRNSRSRGRILRLLKAWRLEGQKSVHECLLTQTQAEELFLQICDHLDQSCDLLLTAWLEPRRRILCRGIGRADLPNNLWQVR
jgi:CRISPR-associated protein Cas2